MSLLLALQDVAAPAIEAPAEAAADGAASTVVSAMELVNGYAHLFMAAFLVTLLATPIARRIAIARGIVDRPNEARKIHTQPVAYLGGIAVFLGLAIAIILSWFTLGGAAQAYPRVAPAVLVGMVAIVFTGFADDVWGWDPRLKIAGQLVAAAGLAVADVGTRAAEGILRELFRLGPPTDVLIPIPGFEILCGDLYYWVGTALIAVFVLGGCNAANLIDGLDGLLSGVIAIALSGLLAIGVLMALEAGVGPNADTLVGARIVLCVAGLGAVLGFLPHNFRPASIFLGDCGSLLLGYVVAVVILTLGDRGQTHLVVAGLIVYAIPIMDTTLAMLRRKLAGKPMSSADDQHIHHQLRRALGGVRRAVFALYGIGALFAALGVSLAWLQLRGGLRVRVVYAIALVLFGFVGVIALKAARRAGREEATRPAPVTLPPTEKKAAP